MPWTIPQSRLSRAVTITSRWQANNQIKLLHYAKKRYGYDLKNLVNQPNCHGQGIGKALMDKAQEIHGNLELDVFKINTIGRNFYSKYGFKQLEEKLHEQTGQQVLRLKYTANKAKH